MSKSSCMTYTAGHFIVDFACGFILYDMYVRGVIDGGIDMVALLFLAYNLLAFGTQYIIGIIGDRLQNSGAAFAIIGCLLAAAGVVVGTGGNSPYLCATLMGLGNAAYHVGGGTDALTRDPGMTRAGIFVSSGSLGIALGCHYGNKGDISSHFIIALLIFVAAAIFTFCRGKRPHPDDYRLPDGSCSDNGSINGDGSCDSHSRLCRFNRLADSVAARVAVRAALPAALILIVAVFIRSYAGYIVPSALSDSRFAFILPAVAAFGGKFLGGILADLLGARRVGAVSLLLSAPLLYLGASSFGIFLCGIFLFNIAMPITLVTLARLFPGREGFAFGLTTLALIVGKIVSDYLPLPDGVALPLTVLLALAAAVAVYVTADNRKPARRVTVADTNTENKTR